MNKIINLKTGLMLIFALFILQKICFTQVTGKKDLWVGELWHQDEDIPSGGWESSYVWPGNHWRETGVGDVRLMNATERMAGLSYGMKNWKEYTGTTYPYVVGSVSSSLIVQSPQKSAAQPLDRTSVV